MRDVSPEQWQQRQEALPLLERRRARHVLTEYGRTLEFVDALEAGEWQAAGRCMYASHESLREDYEVSCAELDLLVQLVREIDGVFGCRMTGGGFGGCAVALVEARRTDAIREALRRGYRAATGIDPAMWVTRATDGAHRS